MLTSSVPAIAVTGGLQFIPLSSECDTRISDEVSLSTKYKAYARTFLSRSAPSLGAHLITGSVQPLPLGGSAATTRADQVLAPSVLRYKSQVLSILPPSIVQFDLFQMQGP